VHVDAAVLAEPDAGGKLDDGTALAPAATERLLCDGMVVQVVEDFRGNVLDVGRRRRTIRLGARWCDGGGITRTCTASGWRATERAGSGSSGRMSAR
jgi:hypothetical protein